MCQGLCVCVYLWRVKVSQFVMRLSLFRIYAVGIQIHTHTNIVHFDIGIYSNLAEVYDVFFRLYIDVGNSHSMDHQSDK